MRISRFAFHDELDLRWDTKVQEWQMLGPLRTTFLLDGVVQMITVPVGFYHDLSSIPRVFRSIIPQIGNQNRASVLHDWLYVTEPNWMSRKLADRLFLEGMKVDGVNWLRRNIMYAAVRAGGWYLWGDRKSRTTPTR